MEIKTSLLQKQIKSTRLKTRGRFLCIDQRLVNNKNTAAVRRVRGQKETYALHAPLPLYSLVYMWNRVGPPWVQKEALLHLPPFGDKDTSRRSSACCLVTLQQQTAPLIRVMCSGTHCPPRSSAPQRAFGPSLSPAGSEVVWGSWDWRRPCSENGWLDPEWENSTSWASPELRPSPPHQTASVVRNTQMKRKHSGVEHTAAAPHTNRSERGL